MYDSDIMIKDMLLEEWFIAKLEDAEAADRLRRKATRPAMREVCRDCLDAVNKEAKNCPLILPALTFNLFSHYLTTRKKKCNNNAMLSRTAYNGIRSSLVHLYRMSGYEMRQEMTKELAQFMSGLKRTVTADRMERGEKLDEGKRPMSYDVYSAMCEIMMKSDDPECLFAHAFLTMEWNLMARADNCVGMNINHVKWQDDSLVFFFGKTKGNQGGENAERPWHVYSNLHHPHVCPVLALANTLIFARTVVFYFQELLNMTDF